MAPVNFHLGLPELDRVDMFFRLDGNLEIELNKSIWLMFRNEGRIVAGG